MIKYKVRDVAKDLGVSVKEISDILQLSVNTVKSRLQRGREKLAKILEKQV